MAAYLVKRLLLMIPTLLGIMLINFVIIQFAPGGPVERVIAQLTGTDVSATSRIGGGQSDIAGAAASARRRARTAAARLRYRGAQGLDPEFIKQLEKQFGFDKPAHERFLLMMRNYLMFDFGKSYFRDVSVMQLIKEKLPVSISLGLWMTLLTYLISIPLGIRKAVHDGERFDVWTSGVAGDRLCDPGLPGRRVPAGAVRRRLVLAVVSLARADLGGLRRSCRCVAARHRRLLLAPRAAADRDGARRSFTTMTFLTKNSFLDEIRKQYVLTRAPRGSARARCSTATCSATRCCW